MRFLHPFGFALLLLTVVGCVPNSTYRRAALVPSPTGEPLSHALRGRPEVAGVASVSDMGTERGAQEGDSALHRSQLQMSGHLRVPLGAHLALGIHGIYSHSSLSSESVVGTPPLGDDRHLWGVGPNLTAHLDPFAGKRLTLGASVAMTLVSAPWASWERLVPATTSYGFGFDESEHRLAREGRDYLLMLRLSAMASFHLHEHVDLHTGLSIQNGLTNIGFDDEPQTGSTLRATDFGAVPFLGVLLRTNDGLFTQLQLYFPLGYEQTDAARGGAQLTLGAAL